ncbi:ABC transporter permease [Enterococcus diestrammenae]|uniref:ABC transporter permease n=1 Tax=Enterococcus diestrammenae TaxID=1155073 RepID=UPI00195D609D
MTVYKAIFEILKENKLSLIIGVVVMIFVSFFMSQEIIQNPDQLAEAKIAVIMGEKTPTAQAFQKYLAQQQEVVELEDYSQKALDDALWFGRVDQILWVPTGFEEKLLLGTKPEIISQDRPGSYGSQLVNLTVNKFMNTFSSYREGTGKTNAKEILEDVIPILTVKGKVHHDGDFGVWQRRMVSATLFNFLAYGLFVSIFSGFGRINMAFNREEIFRRNRISPLSPRKLSRKINVATIGYSLILTVIFVAFVLLVAKPQEGGLISLFLLNTLCFTTCMLSFSALVTAFIKNPEAISGISNIFIMGCCFISGVFVDSDLLPAGVRLLAAFTPTYWFVENNNLVAEHMDYNHVFYQDYEINLLVLLAFTAVFLLLNHLLNSERRKGPVLE